MAEALEPQHAEAARLGRVQAGDPLHELDPDDLEIAKSITASEAEFLDRFGVAIQDGRYTLEDGSLNEAAIQARALNYSSRLTGTANETFVLASDDDAEFTWMLGGEHNCHDCPGLAAGSPYLALDLPTYPGANGTECLFNCNCHLVRSDGVKGFMPGSDTNRAEALKQWERKCINRLKAGRPAFCSFETDADIDIESVLQQLRAVTTIEGIRAIFREL